MTPSAKAFRFVIDGQGQQYDAYLDLAAGAGADKVIDCRYRPVGDLSAKWKWLLSPSLYPSDVDTSEKTDSSYDNALSEIETEIKNVFGTAGDIPLKGFERIEWLIQVGTKEDNNTISRK